MEMVLIGYFGWNGGELALCPKAIQRGDSDVKFYFTNELLGYISKV